MLIDYIYNEICALQALGEHRIKDWIIFKSPWYAIGIIGAYLCIVCVIGPAFMRGRKPYNLNKILIVYNSTQILCSAYITYKCILMGWFWKYKFACEPIDYSTSQHGMGVLEGMWYYFLLKIYDLSDTLFFVLRKKNNQVTFLHLYHHSGMILLTWLAIRTAPGGHGTFLGVVNGFVHVIMYSYYLFASLKFCKIWWKKYVTQLQILQFTLIAIQNVSGILKNDCPFPKITIILFLPHNFLMMYLFIKFYINVYVNKNNESSEIDPNNVSKKKIESSSNEKIKTR